MRRRPAHRRVRRNVFGAFVLLCIGTGAWQAMKPMPEGTAVDTGPVALQSIDFLEDLTFVDAALGHLPGFGDRVDALGDEDALRNALLALAHAGAAPVTRGLAAIERLLGRRLDLARVGERHLDRHRILQPLSGQIEHIKTECG